MRPATKRFWSSAATRTLTRMAPHLTHMGVHDHGFNNVSTYGALWRMAREGRIEADDWEVRFYELALEGQRRRSGAALDVDPGRRVHPFVQRRTFPVRRHDPIAAGARAAHHLGHRLVEEQDAQVNLLARLLQHAHATATYNVFNGRGGGPFDVRGRVAHESLFNAANGTYRGPSTQQGYSPFTTWTRGLAWAMLGFAEELEFLSTLPAARSLTVGGDDASVWMLDAARATCDFYIDIAACADGIPLLGHRRARTGGARRLGIAAGRPVQRSRTGGQLRRRDRGTGSASSGPLPHQPRRRMAARYWQAGLRVARYAVRPAGPYLSQSASHQGLLLHSVYHWPNGWDYVPAGAASRAANRASGATTTHVKSRST